MKVQGHLFAIGKWGILESDTSHSTDGVRTGRILVDLEKPIVPVRRILNLTSKEKRIEKDASIATCEAVQCPVAKRESWSTVTTTRTSETAQALVVLLLLSRHRFATSYVNSHKNVFSQGPHGAALH